MKVLEKAILKNTQASQHVSVISRHRAQHATHGLNLLVPKIKATKTLISIAHVSTGHKGALWWGGRGGRVTKEKTATIQHRPDRCIQLHIYVCHLTIMTAQEVKKQRFTGDTLPSALSYLGLYQKVLHRQSESNVLTHSFSPSYSICPLVAFKRHSDIYRRHWT